MQRTYGKVTAQDLPSLAAIMQSDLKEYAPDDIINAVVECRKKDDDFITMASLLKILNPQPVYEKTIYLGLKEKNRNGAWLNEEEWAYINGYEKAAMRGDV